MIRSHIARLIAVSHSKVRNGLVSLPCIKHANGISKSVLLLNAVLQCMNRRRDKSLIVLAITSTEMWLPDNRDVASRFHQARVVEPELGFVCKTWKHIPWSLVIPL